MLKNSCLYRSAQSVAALVLSLFLSISAVSVSAWAEDSSFGLFMEPGVTYELGATSISYPSPLSNSTGKVTGFGLGARLGFHLSEAFFAAIDARYAMPQYTDSAYGYSAKSTSTNWGPVVGMQMPTFGMRLWASYILGGGLNPDASGGMDVNFKSATGYRVGAGFRISAFSVNLEYEALKYASTELEQLGPFSIGTSLDSVSLENKSWLVSVSFPLQL